MKKEDLPLILDGLLTESLPASTFEGSFSFRVSDRINHLTKTLNAYASLSYGLSQYFEQFNEGEDVPVEKILLGTKCKDSEHPMYGPTKMTEIANAMLKRIEEKGLSTQRKPEDNQKLARLTAVLEFMVNKDEMSEPMAERLINDFSKHFYSPEAVLKLRENELAGESLSAAYADDNSAASREITSIRAQEKIYKRIGELAKINSNNFTSGIGSIQFNAPALTSSRP